MRCLLVLATLAVVISFGLVTAQKKECDCPDKYEPVCARDSRTYPSECFMNCAKKSKAYDGACIRQGSFLRRDPQPL